MTHLFRSLIFVPGNNPRFLEKAKTLEADIVCFDLEDSVPGAEKASARRMIRSALKSHDSYKPMLFVRTNSPASGMIPDDLQEVVQEGMGGIVIPKVDDAGQVRNAASLLGRMEAERSIKNRTMIIPSIESALGVVNTYGIASSDRRVPAVVFGIFDLLNDMGMEYEPGAAEFARSKVPVDARAAGVAAIDSIWQDLNDPDGLEADCARGRILGYFGKSLIHPDQISTAHRAFLPSPAQVEWAKKICAAYESAVKEGRGATALEGKMIDEVHYKQARAILDVACGAR